ncbi:MAG: Gfo/Idh/MocA family oxidoreductase [Pirellulales bacterium]|nr:Gfo/Idh/MocA family oxidoreductase [Pirellulales bacterium]
MRKKISMNLSCTNITNHVNRRRFLKGAAAAAVSVPMFVPAAALGKNSQAAAGERITIGMIGSGQRACQLAKHLVDMPDAQITATCDPFLKKRKELKAFFKKAYASRKAKGTFKGCADYNDFRDLLSRTDIDAVVITSPEHWHALMAVAAARAKKDIYCEKAMTRTVAEGQAVVKAVRDNKCVFQVGQQQRSDPIFRLAVDMVREGVLGKLKTIKVGVPGNRTGPAVDPQPVPEGFDYDFWLGPAPLKPYQPERVVNMTWMSTYDYSIGYQAGWGCHNVDIAQWGLDADDTGPLEIESTRGVFPSKGICDCPTSWHTEYRYANDVRVIFASQDEIPMGIRFEGSDARLYVNRGRITAGPDSFKPKLQNRLPAGYKEDAYRDGSPMHVRNFLDCVRSRKDPVTTVEIGHRTNTVCQLSDIATRLKRKLRWDPTKEQFVDNDEANKMLLRKMRAPWQM